jgi:hypothetical protein
MFRGLNGIALGIFTIALVAGNELLVSTDKPPL